MQLNLSGTEGQILEATLALVRTLTLVGQPISELATFLIIMNADF